MTLSFAHRIWLHEASFDGAPWLDIEGLSPSHRAQLLALLRAIEPSFPIDDAALETLAYTRLPYPLRSLAECPFECWDVMEARALRYRMWINGGGAWFFIGETTERLKNAMVSAYDFHGEGSDDAAEGSLAVRLEEAQTRACAETAGTELRSVSFVSRGSRDV